MPSKPARICACRFRIPHGRLCPCQKQRKAQADAARESASARGYDAEWRKLRADHLRRQPHCVMCSGRGDTVDHVVPIRERPDLRLDPSNLQTMCASCHSTRKQRQERAATGGGRKFRPIAMGPDGGHTRESFPDRKAKSEVAI